MNASDWRLLRLKDDYYYDENAETQTNGQDDERMSFFGCSEWPKPIVGRRHGDRQDRESGEDRCDSIEESL
jgi:hypothetical protein